MRTTAGMWVQNNTPTVNAIVYRYRGTGGDTTDWIPVGVLTKRVRVLYQGRQVEIFDNLIGYDATASNYWTNAIGTTDTPVSKYITVDYFGEGEQPLNSYQRVNYPYNPRLIMGMDLSVRNWNASDATVTTIGAGAGYSGDNPTAADYIGTVSEDKQYSGLQCFTRAESYDINLLAVPGVTLPSVINAMITVLDTRNDCLGIVDPPLGLNPQEVVDWHNGTGVYAEDHAAFVTNRAALYYPWVQQFDPYTSRDIWLPPSAVVPAVIAYSDTAADVWFAPAGIQRGKVPNARRIEYNLNKGEQDYVYGPGNGNAINSILQFAVDGVVVYGQRTLQRHASSLDRVNVRRMLFYIEKSVARAVRVLNFEQNDAVLWNQFIDMTDPFLQRLRGARALEWYRIVCDANTNTAEYRNNNEMRAKIYLIPTKSAEKIIIDMTLMASGINVSEFIANDLGS